MVQLYNVNGKFIIIIIKKNTNLGNGLRLNNQEYLLSSIQNFWNLFLKNWVVTFKLKTQIF